MIEDAVAGLAGTDRLLVATDFDGVLAPIVDDPAAVAAIPEAMAALRTLAALPETSVAVVSGRGYELLATLVAPADRFTLVGSHGIELGAPATGGDELEQLLDELGALADRFPGLHIEPKAVSVAVHFRRLAADRDEVMAEVDRLADAWPGKLVTGKEVVEFSVGSATKGDAVRVLAERHRATATVYFGDDVTDEDVFAVLGPGDVGVKVGRGQSLATHRLASPTEVCAVLNELAEARAARPAEPDSGRRPG